MTEPFNLPEGFENQELMDIYFDANYEEGSTRRFSWYPDWNNQSLSPNGVNSRITLKGRPQNSYSKDDEIHRPLLDIDFNAALVPSSTPGHFHLYLDCPMKWSVYKKLLEALAEAGIIEPGFATASIARGSTDLRLPGITKEKDTRRNPDAKDLW